MAGNPKLSNTAASAAADAVVDLLNSGTIKIYTATQPANADTAISDQTLLATLTLGNPAFGAASNGVATAEAITADSTADNTGTAAWFRCATSGAATMFDGNISTSGADLNLNSVAISAGAAVSISSFTYTASKG